MEHYLENKMSKEIVFMGTPEYATTILKELIAYDYKIKAIFTQPDKKIGREQTLSIPHVKEFVINNNLESILHQPLTLKENHVFEIINNIKPDFIVVAAYGQILPKIILNIAPCVNLHASLLPKYRGASPIQQAILNNDNFTGVTAMAMEEGLDSGDILGFKYLKINNDMCTEDLFIKLSSIAAELIIEVLANFSAIQPKRQNNNQVNHCSKIIKEDGLVNFDNAIIFYQKYKAYKNWPGIHLKSGLKIKKCLFHCSNTNNDNGKILEIRKDGIIVGCKNGEVFICEVQAPSKKSINVLDYIRGKRFNVGDILS